MYKFPLIALLALAYATPAVADDLAIDITHTSIEQLLNVELNAAAKHPESVLLSAAAVYVLTADEIKRSGAMNIPEALRLVPGLEVARVDASKWAVSVRGFNSRFAQRLLVMIDGRSVYKQLFAGVAWEANDIMLEDVERIEVVRGPGGALWGANAVNGVVNIITKSAHATNGGLVSGGGGKEEKGFGAVRYGYVLSETASARVYAKYFERDNGFHPDGAHDEWDMGRGGFRSDWEGAENDHFTFQGDTYSGEAGERKVIPGQADVIQGAQPAVGGQNVGLEGTDLLFRWTRVKNQQDVFHVQTYYDYTEFGNPLLGERRHTWATEFEREVRSFQRQEITWGIDHRITTDSLDDSEGLQVEPDGRTDNLVSSFIQDQYALSPDELFLTGGIKLEYNDYTGLEPQPTLRLSYLLDPQMMCWGAISRAVRVPSRVQDDIVVPAIDFGPSRTLDAEKLISYEIGFRDQPWHWASFDLAAFYNVYDELVTISPQQLANEGEADTYGAELALLVKPLDRWRLDLAYTYFRLETDSLKKFAPYNDLEGRDPQHQVSLRSTLDLLSNLNFDAGLRYVDSLPTEGVKSYIVGDARIAWYPKRNVELALIAQDLFDSKHFEQGGIQPTQVQTDVFGKLTISF